MTILGWEDRDLPVLRAVVEYCEENDGFADVDSIRTRPGVNSMQERDIRRAFEALKNEEPKLFGNFQGSVTGEVWQLARPTGEARRRLGLWPKPEDRLDQVIRLLEELAAKTTLPEEKEALSRTAKVIRGAGSFSGQFITGVLSGMTGTAITGS